MGCIPTRSVYAAAIEFTFLSPFDDVVARQPVATVLAYLAIAGDGLFMVVASRSDAVTFSSEAEAYEAIEKASSGIAIRNGRWVVVRIKDGLTIVV